ncbi:MULTISPECIES: DUF4148 domain-containing protein [unclassified Acidovorax]|jgi:hypothetical protein|uniref:DUF4148 domain-containing protein n=1 Tax=unclassified Acidovorax TaxID=2684926 RepID=UPI000B3F7CDD|nr:MULTISPECIES: DUF4148 domain-containing protein [unclassified Acidovorax]MBP3980127.1 DUF4148 domain-containing protein [Acidovorax sp. JG5]MBU4423232.1 DUF4148 domain-containing protein [Gammaproteobacteria bacterium]
MTTYRTLAVAAALTLTALAAQADSPPPLDGDRANQPLTATEAPGTLTREAVIADLVASRKAGTLPRDGEWYNAPAPLGTTSAGAWLPGGMPTATSTVLASGDQ